MARESYVISARAMTRGATPLASFCAATWPVLTPSLTRHPADQGTWPFCGCIAYGHADAGPVLETRHVLGPPFNSPFLANLRCRDLCSRGACSLCPRVSLACVAHDTAALSRDDILRHLPVLLSVQWIEGMGGDKALIYVALITCVFAAGSWHLFEKLLMTPRVLPDGRTMPRR